MIRLNDAGQNQEMIRAHPQTKVTHKQMYRNSTQKKSAASRPPASIFGDSFGVS